MKYCFILLYAFLFFTTGLSGQQELGIFFQDKAWQNNRLNPAFFPKNKKVIIGLPGIYNDAFVSGFTIDDIETTNEEGQKILDINRAISFMDASNTLLGTASVETISFGFRSKKWHFNFGHAVNFQGIADYPKSLAQLIWEGNSQFIGQDVPFDTDFQVMGYHEWSLGLAFDVADNISVGGRIKYLSGIGVTTTDPDRKALSLFTDEETYALRLTSDFVVNNAGFLDFNGFSDIRFDAGAGDFNADQLFSSNNGLAFDLGIRGQISNWEFSASVLDIGAIDWEDEVTNYTLSGVTDYAGLDILEDITDDDADFPAILDSLEQIYNPIETSRAFTTDLINRGYGYVAYRGGWWKVGATAHFSRWRDQTFTAFGFGVQGQITDWLSLGTLYSYRYESFDNLGLNAHVAIGPAQLLLATDNIITAFDIRKTNTATFRLGLNLAFGKPEPGSEILNEQNFF